MVNEVYFLEIPMTCCCLGLQKRDELSYPLRVDGDHAGLQYLKRAKDFCEMESIWYSWPYQ